MMVIDIIFEGDYRRMRQEYNEYYSKFMELVYDYTYDSKRSHDPDNLTSSNLLESLVKLVK